MIENRYSMVISMTLIVLCYSSAMPILNLAGLLVNLAQFWTDKLLFLRHFKKPPNYTRRLIYNAISLLEWGVVLHLIFGLFMLTSPNTLHYNEPYDLQISRPFSRKVSKFLQQFTSGNRKDRFRTSHG